jgi:hypothetical protein
MATLVSLAVVPVAYSVLRSELPTRHLLDARFLADKAAAAEVPA